MKVDDIEVDHPVTNHVDTFIIKNSIKNHTIEHGFIKFPIEDNYHLFMNNLRELPSSGCFVINMDSDYTVGLLIENNIRFADIEDGYVLIPIEQIQQHRSDYIK